MADDVRDFIRRLTQERWEGIEKMPEQGGQADAYLVRDQEGMKRRNVLVQAFNQARSSGAAQDPFAAAMRMHMALRALEEDDPMTLGVLKHLKAREGSSTKEIQARFVKEVEALNRLKGQRNVVPLSDYNIQAEWLVTAFQPGGTLEKSLPKYRGNVRLTLTALRPLILLAGKLHQGGDVHRDIKPANIFIDVEGQLVLGDFGIVFQDASDRPTELLDRVGSRDWIPPWANKFERLDEVRPSWDVYTLGKVLWTMLSGKRMPLWFHRDEGYNLEDLFPDEPWMAKVNVLLDHCLVKEEGKCLANADLLLAEVDAILEPMKRGGQNLTLDLARPCRICGMGDYRPIQGMETRPAPRMLAVPRPDYFLSKDFQLLNVVKMYDATQAQAVAVMVYSCDRCGHLELFYLASEGGGDPRPGSAWDSPEWSQYLTLARLSAQARKEADSLAQLPRSGDSKAARIENLDKNELAAVVDFLQMGYPDVRRFPMPSADGLADLKIIAPVEWLPILLARLRTLLPNPRISWS